MSDTTEQQPGKDQNLNNSSEEQEVSGTDVEQLLQQEDPGFFETLKEIAKEKLSMDFSDEDSKDVKSNEVVETSIKEISSKVLSVKGLSEIAKNSFQSITGQKSKNFIFLGLGFGILVFIGLLIWQKDRILQLVSAKPFFLTSYNEISSSVYDFQASEPLIDNIRLTQNLYLLPKIVVNLKKISTDNSLTNPMLAVEFVLQGNNNETLVEAKNRQAEILNDIQLFLNDLTFSQAEEMSKTQQLQLAVLNQVNRILKTGDINKIYVKTFILKH